MNKPFKIDAGQWGIVSAALIIASVMYFWMWKYAIWEYNTYNNAFGMWFMGTITIAGVVGVTINLLVRKYGRSW